MRNGEKMKKKTNPKILKLIEELSNKKEKIWKDIAERLSKPRRNYAVVNIAEINRYGKNGDVIIVPGKVLGYGDLDKKIIVSALSFSSEARKKIIGAKGKCLEMEELLKENPKGSNTRIFG